MGKVERAASRVDRSDPQDYTCAVCQSRSLPRCELCARKHGVRCHRCSSFFISRWRQCTRYCFIRLQAQEHDVARGLFNRVCSCTYCARSYKCWQSQRALSDRRLDTRRSYFRGFLPFFPRRVAVPCPLSAVPPSEPRRAHGSPVPQRVNEM